MHGKPSHDTPSAVLAVPSSDLVGAAAWTALLLAVAVLVQLNNPGVTDVSWLIVVSERMLAGDRLYVDIIEVNPPASVLIYLPLVRLAQALGVAAEHVILVSLLGAVVASTMAAGRVLQRAGLLENASASALAATLAFAVLPGNSFAQREHVGLVLMLPALALAAARARPGWRIGPLAALAIGIPAGMAVCIKPHFAAAILLPQLYAAWRAGSLRVLVRAENWTVAVVVLAYAGATVLLFPQFLTDVLPVVLDTYRPARSALREMVELVQPFVAFVLVFLACLGRRFAQPTTAVPLLAAAGFLLAFFEQSKGWQYHYYPAVALLTFVVTRDLVEAPLFRRASGSLSVQGLRIAAAASLMVAAAERFRPYTQVSSSLEAEIRRLSPRPTLIAVTGDLGVTNPLTRRVNAIWTSRVASQWMTEMVALLASDPTFPKERSAFLERYVAQDRAMLAEDLRRHAPRFLLLDVRGGLIDWRAWLREDPELSRLFDGYAFLAANRDVELYLRRDP